MKHYVIGIDGGASRSKGILVDDQDRLMAESASGGLNPLALGWEAFGTNLAQLLGKFREEAAKGNIAAVCAGLAGGGNAEVRRRAREEIIALLPQVEVQIITDAQAALWGAFGGGPGLLLIAGTGSICLGMDSSGQTARAGGWGRLLGDEGSGYWIASEAIRLTLRHLDARLEEPQLIAAICTEFTLHSVYDIVPRVYSGDLTPDQIARLAKRILPLSQSEAVARDIVHQAGLHLADLVINAAQKLNISEPDLALWGGLWKSPEEELQKALGLAFDRREYHAILHAVAEPPEWGAIRYLRKNASMSGNAAKKL